MIPAPAALLATAVLSVPALPGGTDVDYQLGGAVDPAANVGIVGRDRTEPPAATCTTYGANHAVELRDRGLTPTGVHGWC